MTVTWTTQSMGQFKTHTGRVIAFIPAGEMVDIPEEFSHIPWERSRISAVSKNDRYLVVVNEGVTEVRPGKRGRDYKERLYAPIAYTIKKEDVNDDILPQFMRGRRYRPT